MIDVLRFTILGCGSSPGVPRVNGDWGACDPANPKNRRRRCAMLVERVSASGTTTVVIDCGPDFREQMLSESVTHLDAIVLTHPHADHIHGLDDVRGFMLAQRQLIPVYADDQTFERVFEAFAYCFETPPGSDYPPIVKRDRIVGGERFSVDGAGGVIEILPFFQDHGKISSLGLRIGPLAYCSDVSGFPSGAQDAIADARHIIIDALQYRPHPSHFSIGQALEWIERLEIPSATLTHMNTPVDYATLASELPNHVKPGFDGLKLEFPISGND